MIEKLIASSRITEVDTVSTKTSGAFAKTTLNTDLNLVEINTLLVSTTQKLTIAIKRSQFESVLDEKDEVRDIKIRAIYYLLFGLLHHPEPEISAAAQVVLNEFEKYGLAMVSEGYGVESSHVSSMLTDFAKPKVQTAIALLTGVAQLITELEAAETDFEQASIAYDEEKAKEGVLESASVVKKEVVIIINEKLLVYLNAMVLVNAATYSEFAQTVAQIIADNNTAVKKRRNKNTDTDE
ncbi:MAG: hypothetical protein HQ522_03575 [Bacteroidetes bacterium]|nr:hypothetical protein [Bacteroidota bacterium]